MSDKELEIYVTDLQGVEHVIPALDGWRVMEIIRDFGLPIKAECGGACSCATCHVHIEDDWIDKLMPVSDEEEDMLDLAYDVDDASRLSCQIIMSKELNGLRLKLAPILDA